MRDLQKDLALIQASAPAPHEVRPDDQWAYFILEAREGWPEAIRRAMAAEKIIRKLLNTPDGRGICGVYALEELEELADVLNGEGGEQA